MNNKEKNISLFKDIYLFIFNLNLILILSEVMLNTREHSSMAFNILLTPLDLFLDFLYKLTNENIGLVIIFILWGINEVLLLEKLKLYRTQKFNYLLCYFLFVLTSIALVVNIVLFFVFSDSDFNFNLNN